MGTSSGKFTKYPRTPHLFGSTGTDDDRHLNEASSNAFLNDASLIIEEKLDGTNVGIHFGESGELILQCRGHLITAGMHSQYDLFKQWTQTKRSMLQSMLTQRYILFGEWLYARHTVSYNALSHYFFEFDIFDKQASQFLDLATRLDMLQGSSIKTVPVVHQGVLKANRLVDLIGPSVFDSEFRNPLTGRIDNRMEGIYLRTEKAGIVTGRAKFVRPEFTEAIKQSTHWQYRSMVVNQLAEHADIWNG